MRGQGKPTHLYLCLLSVCKMYVQFEMPEQRERRRPFKGQLLNNIHVMYSFVTKNLIKCLERKETEEHFHFRSLSRCRRLYGQDCRIWQKNPSVCSLSSFLSCRTDSKFQLKWNLEAKFLRVNFSRKNTLHDCYWLESWPLVLIVMSWHGLSVSNNRKSSNTPKKSFLWTEF